MKINKFFLGLLIINIMIFNYILNLLMNYPELFKDNILSVYILLILGIIGIITNTFNAFEK
jgi:hypothetical protein